MKITLPLLAILPLLTWILYASHTAQAQTITTAVLPSDLQIDLENAQKDVSPLQSEVKVNESLNAILNINNYPVYIQPQSTVSQTVLTEMPDEILHPDLNTSEAEVIIQSTDNNDNNAISPTQTDQNIPSDQPQPSDQISPSDSSTDNSVQQMQQDQQNLPNDNSAPTDTPAPVYEYPNSNPTPNGDQPTDIQTAITPNSTDVNANPSQDISPSPSQTVQGASTGPNLIQNIVAFLKTLIHL